MTTCVPASLPVDSAGFSSLAACRQLKTVSVLTLLGARYTADAAACPPTLLPVQAGSGLGLGWVLSCSCYGRVCTSGPRVTPTTVASLSTTGCLGTIQILLRHDTTIIWLPVWTGSGVLSLLWMCTLGAQGDTHDSGQLVHASLHALHGLAILVEVAAAWRPAPPRIACNTKVYVTCVVV